MGHNFTKKSSLIQNPLFFAGVLIVVTLILYWQTKDFGFVNYDDNIYVYNNKHIQKELSIENLKWALTASYEASWQPVVWLSYMIGYHFHGLNPGWHHLTNVFFHISNALLLFFLLKQITGALYRSAFIAFLFALHPIHMESVVWITERKDVLCAFFWMLSIWSYLHYLKRPGLLRYTQLFALLSLSLMTKPMPVTLPFTLLLLDFWPLGRVDFKIRKSETLNLEREQECASNFSPHTFIHIISTSIANLFSFIRRNIHLFLEKLPLFIPVILSIIITIMVSKSGGAVPSLKIFPLQIRIENALFSYICYIEKMMWPFNLAVFYPHPGDLPFWKVTASLLLILIISVISIRMIQKRPWLFVGWFWYLGTLVPVIGLIQIGGYAMADRFAYIPFIGIYIIIAWGIPLLFSNFKKKTMISIISISFILIIFLTAWNQIKYWTDSIRLFEHALEVTSNNAIAHNNLGTALRESKKQDKALMHFMKALQIDPKLALTYNNLGMTLAEKGETDKAIYYYTQAIHFDPEFSEAYNNLGIVLFQKNKLKEAIEHFQTAIQRMPDNTDMQHNLSIILQTQKKIDAAIEKIQTRLENITDDPILYYQLGNMYLKKGEDDKAILNYQNALSLKSDFKPALNSLSNAFTNRNDYSKAIFFLEKLIALDPDKNALYYDIACLYAKQNKKNVALEWLTKAIDKGFDNWELIKTDRNLLNIRNSTDYINLEKKASCLEDKDKL